jgi:lysophospholipase L1-like esterase
MAAISLLFIFLAGCAGSPQRTPELSPAALSTITISPTSTPAAPTSTLTFTITPTATLKWPLTIVFYGDSLLKVGEVGRQAKWSFSFVDDLREKLDPEYNLITVNYGGRDAKWASENLDAAVLSYRPDSVTLWWGFNDLLGCPGFFKRENELIPAKLDWLVERHIEYMKKQIDALLEKNISVLIVTAIPIDGKLPWTHLDENNQLVWEKDQWCDYNIGLEQLAAAQRTLVEEYAADGESVFLVDAWKIFTENRGTEGMYLDIMHPGSAGANRIAEEWIRVFAQTGAWLRMR